VNQSVSYLRRAALTLSMVALIAAAPVSAAPAAAPTKSAPAKAAKAPKAKKAPAPRKTAEELRKEHGVHAPGTDWIGLQAGYAKRSGETSGDGLAGAGLTFQHMIDHKYAFAAGTGLDIIGHYAGSTDLSLPMTVELRRHFNWRTAGRPYLGLGTGVYYRKAYRTTSDYSTYLSTGPHLSVGFTGALDARHVFGFEMRWASVQVPDAARAPNSVFGDPGSTQSLWTAKLTWGLAY
jgi:outer membrane protein W